MKRLIAAGCLLVIVVSVYLIGYFYINDACDTANKYLDTCVDVYKADKDATDEAERLKEYWDKAETILSLFANHSTIDEIERAIGSLKTYSRTTGNEIFYEYSGTVKTLLHQLMEDTVPSVHSIF